MAILKSNTGLNCANSPYNFATRGGGGGVVIVAAAVVVVMLSLLNVVVVVLLAWSIETSTSEKRRLQVIYEKCSI